MQSSVPNSLAAELDHTGNDLGPLAWMLDELRKSLASATKALKRFVRDAEAARGSDLAAVDASQLRIARQQLHQAVGALEMVGLAGPALVLRAMEAAVQKFVQQPGQCSHEAAAKIERASFALTEYLEGVLADKPVSAVSLFPQYRDIQELIRADRIHPADLWPFEWRWLEPELAVMAEPRNYDDDARALMDYSVLQILKGKAPQAALKLKELSLGLSAKQTGRQPRIFWKIAAAYFEAVAHDLLGLDIYVKRAASRILLQYASLGKGDAAISDRLAQDLLFFCAQAVSDRASDTPILSAVRLTYDLTRFKPVDYELVQFGRFDPALLAQARKRITSAKETWSSLSAGDVSKFRSVADQFSLVTDSLLRLYPPSVPLAQALTRAIDTTVHSAHVPRIELAMEVATSVLYIEAALDDLDPNDPQLTVRTENLAERLEAVRVGGEPQPLEGWMEELYRRVSDKQTMGSVVGELRVSLGELENSLDAFFRNPQDKTLLHVVPVQLSQMRGVLSVLGLDQASHAVLSMKNSVEHMLIAGIDEQVARVAGTFDHLGNNLGALSFLIDMLNYQPALAKKLFVFDEEKGELKPLMGRTQKAASAASTVTLGSDLLSREVISLVQEAGGGNSEEKLSEKLDALATHAALAEQPVLAQTARDAALAVSANNASAAASALMTLASTVMPAQVAPASQAVSADFEEDDLRDIFLEEAREVLGNALEAIAALASDPGEVAELTVLRRAFHTLKGSSRMVGLNEFGEAAWSLEQLLNSWLADQKTATTEFRALTSEVMAGFGAWIADIAANQDAPWSAVPFRSSADAMRIEGRYSALRLVVKSGEPGVPALPMEATAAGVLELPELQLEGEAPKDPSANLLVEPLDKATIEADAEFGILFDTELAPAAPDATAVDQAVTSDLDMAGIDFDRLFSHSADDNASPRLADLPVASMPESVSAEFESGEAIELSAADFDKHFRLGTAAPDQVAPVSVGFPPAAELVTEVPESAEKIETIPLQPVDVAAAPAVAAREKTPETAPLADASEDEKIKVIGALRIGIPLYNVYLNEADEWSRRLVTEVAEWAMERQQRVGASTIALAHSLAGSSATVGFDALSKIARALEHALQKSRAHHSDGAAKYGQVFVDAAEDIRRLLNQFAAGFLKEPEASLLGRLNELDFPDAVIPPEDEFYDSDFFADPAQADYIREELLNFSAPELAKSAYSPPAFVTPTAPAVEAPPVRLVLSAPDAVPTPVVAIFGEEGDEPIDAVDAIDPDLFPIFEEEGAELMPQLGGALRQWSARPGNHGARLEVLRVLHTLKGSARLAGALRLGEMAHRVESEIEHVGSEAAATQKFEPLLTRFDAMQATFEGLRQAAAAGPALPSSAPAVAEPLVRPASVSKALDFQESSTKEVVASELTTRTLTIPPPQAMAMQPLRQAAAASIRVRSQLLDRMVNQTGEVIIARSRLEAEVGQLRSSLNDMNGNLNRLRQQLRDIELQAETQMQTRLAQTKDAQTGFDPLEFDRFTRVQELTRMMAESVNDVATVQRTLQRTVEAAEDDLVAQARQTRELQRDLLRTRMVEFDGISDRLYRVVRQASKETGKQVRLDLLGGTTEMDRGTLDRMTPAFEHLLRNCVTHGIESPQDRANAGKDPVGLITVHLHQEGNDVSVDFSDDGAGLDLHRIREKALSLGLVTAEQSVDVQEAAKLIFMPGFSTAEQVTELAGRGIGMDVVRSEVNSLGGRIETSSVSGKGTHFKLVLPLTTAVTQVVIIRAGSLSVGVPANVVETVRRTTAKELQQAYNTGTLDVAGEAVPFMWSGALLQASPQSSEVQAKATQVVIFRSAAQRIALHVDEVLGNREVVVKNLGPQLSRLPGLAGMSVLASGAVVLIYNPVALATVYGQQARAWSADSAEPHVLEASGASGGRAAALVAATPQLPLILVVDDSITVRRVTQRLLQREGYRVSMAADGLQALERLQEERPAVVLSDIEMPRMDGFDLARNIRADVRLSHLPIIMITSRIAEKHREHAKALGVNDYLGKPYSEEELLRLVKNYCATEVAVLA
ncbi:MAG: response regulator [Polaromonas sp.]|uniref:hybrid sensor histidine kinase/response regulator n=1 Tax=Polaromonas sp. TaxID=1869339 RepID=UPI0017DE2A81|nr:Hpt domain-containing protein [Polaromonas sp.]NMM08963.1 response regulator [Polaromonas sp.]